MTALAQAPGPARGTPAAPDPLSTTMSVLVVAPHELVLCGVRSILEGVRWVDRCLLARSASDAGLLARRHRPAVALIDLGPGRAGAEAACRTVRRASAQTRILLFGATDELPPRTVASLGAAGFVSQRWPSAEIRRALRLCGRGLHAPRTAARSATELSARQQEILGLLAEGETNDAIARSLHVSPNTVKQHASALYRKLGARNRAEAIGRAQAMGLLT